jgi:hypothetical protein
MYIDKTTLGVLCVLLVGGLLTLGYVLKLAGSMVGLGSREEGPEGPALEQPPPSFVLRTADGVRTFPDDFPTIRVLLFADPGCGSCQELVSDLSAAHSAMLRSQVLLVTTADLEVAGAYPGYRAMVGSVGRIAPAIRRTYAVRSAPFAVVLDDSGRVAWAGHPTSLRQLQPG